MKKKCKNAKVGDEGGGSLFFSLLLTPSVCGCDYFTLFADVKNQQERFQKIIKIQNLRLSLRGGGGAITWGYFSTGVRPTGFPRALENHKKVPCIKKSWNLKKTEKSWKSWNFVK